MNDQLSRDLVSLKIERDVPRARAGSVWRWILALAAIAAIAFTIPYAKRQTENFLFKRELATTTIVKVSPIQSQVDLTATGYVIPQVVAKVGGKLTGRIAKVHLKEGDTVRIGQMLFELDPADERSELLSAQARVTAASAKAEAAKAQAAELELQLTREKKLADLGATAPANAENLEARVVALRRQAEAAEADIRVTRAEANASGQQLKNLSIVAPINGTAVSKPAQLGDVITPSMTLVELVDFDSLMVEVDVPEARLSKVKPNGPCEVVLEAASEQRLKGVVADFTPRVNRAKATATVKVRLVEKAERLWPDMSARVSFLASAIDDAIRKLPAKKLVAQSAVVERNSRQGLWTVVDGTVAFLPVTLGSRVNDNVELISGPEAGTTVVLFPPADLKEGQKVKDRNAVNNGT